MAMQNFLFVRLLNHFKYKKNKMTTQSQILVGFEHVIAALKKGNLLISISK